MRVLVECIAKFGQFAHLVLDITIDTHVTIDIETAFGLDGDGSVILEDDVVLFFAVKCGFTFFYCGAVLAIAGNSNDHIAKLQKEASFASLWNAYKAELLHHLATFELYAVSLATNAAELARDILAACNNARKEFHHKEPPGCNSSLVRFPSFLSSVNVRCLIR